MDVILTLMHRDMPVVDIFFNENGTYSGHGKVYTRELLPYPAQKDIGQLKAWLEERSVPKTRHNVTKLLKSIHAPNTGIYMIDNLGLSLTDTYWFLPSGALLKWKDVNLYENDFSEALVIGGQPSRLLSNTRFSKYSPDATLKGDLEKKWIINETGKRLLIKGNFGIGCQQSLNEKFASLIHKKQGLFPYVDYDTISFGFFDKKATCCISENCIKDDKTEMISAIDIVEGVKQRGSDSVYNMFLEGCAKHGLSKDEVKAYLNYVISIDYIITNRDRHLNNIAVYRDTDTLNLKAMSAIYDNGSSLFWDISNPVITDKTFKNIETHSFCTKEQNMLKYIYDYKMVDLDKLPTKDEFYAIYSEADTLSEQRIEFVWKCFIKKVQSFSRLQNNERT